MDKLLSIIVPSYNMEKYLPKCLGSLIVDDAALLQKLDVIVVNDGSKDRTSSIGHEFESKYPGVFRVIDKPNGHYGSCINAGLKIAIGLYVKVLDADDWFNTENLLCLLRMISDRRTHNQDVDLIVSDFNIYNNDDVRSRKYNFLPVDQDFDLSHLKSDDGQDLWMHAVTYRLDILHKINYRQLEGMAHTDLQWLFLPFSAISSVAYFPSVVYEYLESRPGNTSNRTAYYATYHGQVYMVEQMIGDYNRVCTALSAEQNSYLRRYLACKARTIYRVYLLTRNSNLQKDRIVQFDTLLEKSAPWLYREMDGLPMGRHLRFKFVAEWRRNKKFTLKSNVIWMLQTIYSYLMHTTGV